MGQSDIWDLFLKYFSKGRKKERKVYTNKFGKIMIIV